MLRRSSFFCPVRRRTATWLLLSALLLCWPAHGQDIDTLHRRLHHAMEKERWDKAMSAALAIVELDPTNATAHYNAGCVLARMGESEAAIEALQQAAELGFSSVATMSADEDLESLRDHPGFAAAFERVEENHVVETAAFKEQADQDEPLIYPAPAGADPDVGERYPLIVLLHGRGGRAENLARLFRPSAAKIGAVLVVPEAFEPYGEGFRWGDQEKAAYRVQRAIEFSAERYAIDPDRVILAGFSQGAYISLRSVVMAPERFAGVVAIGACGTVDFDLASERYEDPPSVYIGIGSEDRSFDRCRPMAKAYEEAGFGVKLRVYKGYGHVFPRNYEWELDRAFRFVQGPSSRRR